jgi:hypothetical protein
MLKYSASALGFNCGIRLTVDSADLGTTENTFHAGTRTTFFKTGTAQFN